MPAFAGTGDTRWKKLQSRIANAVRRRILDDGVPDTGCGLKLVPRATWLCLPYFDHMHRFVPALVKRLGGVIAVVPVHHRHRVAGVSKYTAWNRLWVGIVDMWGGQLAYPPHQAAADRAPGRPAVTGTLRLLIKPLLLSGVLTLGFVSLHWQ